MPPTPLSRFSRAQAGVALMTVLLIVFLASVTATSLAALQQIAIRRSTLLQHQQQARLYTLGVEQWALLILARDRKQSETDHPGEAWANLPAVLPIKEGVLAGRLRDLQGCFNLNNLWAASKTTPNADNPDQPNSLKPGGQQKQGPSDQNQTPKKATPPNPAASGQLDDAPEASESTKPHLDQVQFQFLQRLLTHLELKPELAQAIADWIDPDQEPLFPDGAEDSDYTILTPPYLAANRPLSSVSELRLIKGIDQEIYAKLAPLVCALPPGTPLNVNTAPAPILAALTEGGDIHEMEQVLESRPKDGYKKVDDFLNAAKLTVDAQLKTRLSVDSQHFSLRVEAQVGDGRAMLYSILYRDKNGVRVTGRSFGNQD